MELLVLPKEQLLEKAFALKKQGWQLLLVSGVDRGDKFQTVYHFGKHGNADLMQITCDLGKDSPAAPSIAHIFPLADWMECETYDLFGISFTGHPHLKRLFLPEDFDGHPLRKDFVAYKRLLPGG